MFFSMKRFEKKIKRSRNVRIRGIEKTSIGENIKALVIVGGSRTKRVNVTSEACQTRVSTKDRRRRDLLPGFTDG